jgi:hypothetical protein
VAWTFIRPRLVLAEDLQPITAAILAQGEAIKAQGSSLKTIERYILLTQIDELTAKIAALEFYKTADPQLWTSDDQVELSMSTTERNRAETTLAALD